MLVLEVVEIVEGTFVVSAGLTGQILLIRSTNRFASSEDVKRH